MADMKFEYKNIANVLSKAQIGNTVYYLKDAEAREALLAEIARLGTAAYRNWSDVVEESSEALVSGKAVAAYLENTLADVTKALIFQGVAINNPEGGEAVQIEGNPDYVPSKGDVVVYGSKEFVYDGAKWIELGDESLYLSKADAASTYVKKTLTIAGIDLQDNITKEELIEALGLKSMAFASSASGSIEVITGVKDASYTPAGNVKITVGTAGSDEVTSQGTFTPAGTVSGNITSKGTVAIARDDTNGTAVSGTVSAPSITVTPNTAKVQHIADLGELPSYTKAQYVAPTLGHSDSEFATEGVTATISANDAEMLVFAAAIKNPAITTINYNEGSYTAAEFNAGKLPSFGAEQTVVTGIASAEASAPTFTGDKFGASFTGDNVAFTADFAGTPGNVSVSGYYATTGAISASFEGTAATIKHEVETASKKVTVTPDAQ